MDGSDKRTSLQNINFEYASKRLYYMPKAGKPYWVERFSTIDLRVLTSLDQLFFILKQLITFV